jgi:hypothetical protein
MAQLDPPLGAVLRPFDRMRRQRNMLDYPQADTADLEPEDVRDDQPKVRAICEIAQRVLDQMSPY